MLPSVTWSSSCSFPKPGQDLGKQKLFSCPPPSAGVHFSSWNLLDPGDLTYPTPSPHSSDSMTQFV